MSTFTTTEPKNDSSGRFHVMCCLSQYKNFFKEIIVIDIYDIKARKLIL